jgi:hypothetical protein
MTLQGSLAVSTSTILSFLRLHSVLSAGHPDALSLNLNEVEGAAVFAAAEILLGIDGENKRAIIHGFHSQEGEFRGTTCMSLYLK